MYTFLFGFYGCRAQIAELTCKRSIKDVAPAMSKPQPFPYFQFMFLYEFL